MNRALLLLPLLAIACSTNASTVGVGQFNAPTGLAATGAGDRDVMFIANTGRDGLRALQLCNGPLLLTRYGRITAFPHPPHTRFPPSPPR